MKSTMCRFRFENSNGRGKSPVEGSLQVFRRNGGRKRETGHLAERVYTRIGASRALRQGRFSGNPPQRGLKFALNCSLARLHLPAAELAAVVSEGQLPGLERGRGLGLLGHGEGLGNSVSIELFVCTENGLGPRFSTSAS